MVRDEGSSLKKTLPSVLSICDHAFVLVDSETTDDTEEVVESFSCKHSQSPWINFGTNRSLSIELAMKAHPDTDWILIFDGHEEFKEEGEENLRDFISKLPQDVDSISINQIRGGGEIAPQIRLIKPHVRYHGPVHHYSDHKKKVRFKGLTVIHRADWSDDRTWRGDQNKTWSIEQMKPLADSGNMRYVYHLTMTYHDVGRYQDAVDLAWKYTGRYESERLACISYGIKSAIKSKSWNEGLALARKELFDRPDYYFLRAWLCYGAGLLEEAGLYYGLALVTPMPDNPSHIGRRVDEATCKENLKRLSRSLTRRDEH